MLILRSGPTCLANPTTSMQRPAERPSRIATNATYLGNVRYEWRWLIGVWIHRLLPETKHRCCQSGGIVPLAHWVSRKRKGSHGSEIYAPMGRHPRRVCRAWQNGALFQGLTTAPLNNLQLA